MLPLTVAQMIELRTTPVSIALALAKLAGMFVIGCFLANKGQPFDYTLIIPFILLPSFIWFAFVPRKFRYGKEGFEFTSRFSGTHFIPADRLRHWGQGNSVYLLEFDKQTLRRRTLQIALWFYPVAAKTAFLDFMQATYPDRYTSFWLGIRGYAWRGAR